MKPKKVPDATPKDKETIKSLFKEAYTGIDNACQIALFLRKAKELHDENYPNGNWKAVNEIISLCRLASDSLIIAKGKWPENKIAIGNDQVLEILDEISESSQEDLQDTRITLIHLKEALKQPAK